LPTKQLITTEKSSNSSNFWMTMARPDYLAMCFPYTTTNPWPFHHDPTLDWITAVHELEHWLDTRVGPRMARWCWMGIQCRVAFEREPDRTLFLLRWH